VYFERKENLVHYFFYNSLLAQEDFPYFPFLY
jgi:hypothetical protein